MGKRSGPLDLKSRRRVKEVFGDIENTPVRSVVLGRRACCVVWKVLFESVDTLMFC